jgi:hypothetical protein
MKNIPSPESFISGVLSSKKKNNQLDKEESKVFKNTLETIQDDQGSDFQSDDNFEEESNNKMNASKEDEGSVSSLTEKEKSVFHKQDTLGIKNEEYGYI